MGDVIPAPGERPRTIIVTYVSKESPMNAMPAVLVAIMLAVSGLVTPVTGADTHATHVIVAPAELQWADVPSLPPGARVAVIEGPLTEAVPFIARFKFPADYYKIPAHWHPGIEHVTVLSGALNMGVGDTLDPEKSKVLSAGSVSIMQPNTNHFAWTKEETVVQVHGVGPWGVTFVNPADDPRKK